MPLIPKLACTLEAALARYGNLQGLFTIGLLDAPKLLRARREIYDGPHKRMIQYTHGCAWANIVALEEAAGNDSAKEPSDVEPPKSELTLSRGALPRAVVGRRWS